MTDLIVRPLTQEDVPQISALLMGLVRAGLRTLPADPADARNRYVTGSDVISILGAFDGPALLGLQVLKDIGGGAVCAIGTHVAADAGRRGVGRRLFSETLLRGRAAGIEVFEAPIADTNAMGLAYYDAMGFRDARREGDRIVKRRAVDG